MNTKPVKAQEKTLMNLASQLGHAIAYESMHGHIDMSKTFFPAIKEPARIVKVVRVKEPLPV